jgi:hypothetical protein
MTGIWQLGVLSGLLQTEEYARTHKDPDGTASRRHLTYTGSVCYEEEFVPMLIISSHIHIRRLIRSYGIRRVGEKTNFQYYYDCHPISAFD